MNTITKITSKKVPESIIPARVIAYRRNAGPVVAGDTCLRPALTTLFFLITGDRLMPKEMRYLIRNYSIRVSESVREVL